MTTDNAAPEIQISGDLYNELHGRFVDNFSDRGLKEDFRNVAVPKFVSPAV